MPTTRPSPPIALDAPSGATAAVVGNKFARLAAARQLTPVPSAWCLPTDWFTSSLGEDRLQRLTELFADIAATLGNAVTGLEPKLASILDGLTLDQTMRSHLATAITELTDTQPDAAVAVRSSTTVEDGTHHSHAGLYATYLHLTSIDAVQQAVLDCWRSFYSPRAILGRLRAGDLDPAPRMAVILQRMLTPRLAGVAFTQSDHTLIEAAEGTGDQLVAGLADTAAAQIAHGASAPTPYQQVARLAETLQAELGGDVDLEWAWDGTQILLLQVRPVTVTLHPRTVTGPVFTCASLYFDDTLPPDLPLGEVAELYAAYTAKRAPLYRLADRHGIRVGQGWVVALNGTGLSDPACHPDWWERMDDTVVLDLGATLRQHILPAAELTRFLTDALNLTGDPATVHPLILREFTHGQAGMITHHTPTGETVMEHAPQGLLAINRGLTEPERRILPPLTDTTAWQQTIAPDGWHPSALRQLAAFTTMLNQQLPGAYAEWVLSSGRPQFIDVSVTDTAAVTTTGATVIAPGTARGPLLNLDDTEELTKLSIAPIVSVNFRADAPQSTYITQLIQQVRALPAKPIISAHRPYVILSLLINEAAGFVFQGGSLLCHLAILLREAGIPAAITPDDLPTTGQHTAVISNGTVAVTTTGSLQSRADTTKLVELPDQPTLGSG